MPIHTTPTTIGSMKSSLACHFVYAKPKEKMANAK